MPGVTDDHDAGSGALPGPGVAGRPALGRLVGDVEAFADATWGRDPLLRPGGDPAAFTDLLDAPSVDELLSDRGLRTPFLRVAKSGSTVASSAFTAPGGVGAGIADQVSDDKLVGLFAGGSTLVLQALHRTWPPIIAFCQQLAADLGHPVQANAYVTPPQNQGFDDHYDVHDVFVLQIAGRKRWTIHAPVLPAPLRDQPWTARREAVRRAAAQEPVIDTVLEPGDALYLPRGYLHAARALGGVTIHLTLGVHSWTRYALAEELVALALGSLAEDEEARGSLALGTGLGADDLGADIDTVAKLLTDAVARLDPADVAGRLQARRRDTQRAAPIGPLAQLDLIDGLSATTPVGLREHLDVRMESGPAGPRLVSRAGRHDVDGVPAESLDRLLAGTTLPAGDLGLESARALITAGLVVAR